MKYGYLFAFAEQITSENIKRVLYTIFLLLIIVLAFLSLIGSVIIFITKKQGELLDREIYDPVKHNVIKSEKHFLKYATKKSNLIFFKKSAIPVLLILVGAIVLIVYDAVNKDWSYNPMSVENGFGSLLFIWDFSTIIKINPEGVIGMVINWPELVHSPTFNIEYWCGYVSGTFFIVGGLWYLFEVQGLIGRLFRIFKLKRSIFDKSLENFNLADSNADAINKKLAK